MDLITFWYLIHAVNGKKQYLASRTDGWTDGWTEPITMSLRCRPARDNKHKKCNQYFKPTLQQCHLMCPNKCTILDIQKSLYVLCMIHPVQLSLFASQSYSLQDSLYVSDSLLRHLLEQLQSLGN